MPHSKSPIAPPPQLDVLPEVTADQIWSLLVEIRTLLQGVHDRLSGQMKQLYSVDEIATLTGRSRFTVRRWIATGLVKATRVSGTGPRGRLLIPRAELEMLVISGRGGNIPPLVAGNGAD